MPRSINVLVVDDSALMRRVISRLLETQAGIKVIDTAASGEEAIQKVRAQRPDVVTMDVEMPGLNGVQTVSRLMKECPVPVVMLSALTIEGARVTMEALAAGAVDFVPKPQKAGGTEQMVAELARKIRVANRVSPKKCPAVPPQPRPAARQRKTGPAPSRGSAGSGSTPVVPGKDIAPADRPSTGTARPARKPEAAPRDGIPRPEGKTATGPAAAPSGSSGRPSGTPAHAPSPVITPSPRKPAVTPSTGTPGPSGTYTYIPPAAAPKPAGVRVPAPGAAVSKSRLPGQIELVVIGSSTGGPAALQAILPALPGDLPCGIVIVQHIPVGFSGPMAEHLNRKCRLEVKHAERGDRVTPGLVLVAPAGYDLTFRKIAGQLAVHLDKGDKPVPPGGFRPSVDVVMNSAAEVAGAHAMGVLLTGMGRDGARGMLAIKQRGGYTIAQDESTSVVYGMPKAAAELGAAVKVLPLPGIAAEITRLV